MREAHCSDSTCRRIKIQGVLLANQDSLTGIEAGLQHLSISSRYNTEINNSQSVTFDRDPPFLSGSDEVVLIIFLAPQNAGK